ncbi:E3 ubiquitin-protein ligase SINA-like 7 [Lolium perenne]|uniref:E3 ubiquitin-protein ligase SINA-like 7 n=1 Tax=Lolium perenne TaxID=4522 RepID=UPI0021F5C7EE|nr:E3 ubiquitin-protein ligase SINA-like 7 isoform X1 [Lolium perenne]
MGNVGREGALAVLPAAMPTEPQLPVAARMLYFPAELLDCHACRHPLKPPIYKCEAEHRVCSTCRVLHGEACSGALVHSRMADEFAAAAREPCEYERYGCDAGGVAYHLAAEHRSSCPHAPCGCPEGCGFLGSRQMLLNHVSGPDHSRPIIDIRYGQEWKQSLPLSRRWYLLLGEETQAAVAAGAGRHRNVFLVSLGERGDTTAVSVVCVRADGGAPEAAQFSCRLAVEHPGDGTKVIFESPLVTSSSLSGGAPAPGGVRSLPVPKEYLSGDSIPLSIHIHKLEPPASVPSPPTAVPLPPTTPASPRPVAATVTVATPSPRPVAAIVTVASPPPRPVAAAATVTLALQSPATDQSNKKRKATNPKKFSTANRS